MIFFIKYAIIINKSCIEEIHDKIRCRHFKLKRLYVAARNFPSNANTLWMGVMKFLKCVIVFWSLEFDLQPAYAELFSYRKYTRESAKFESRDESVANHSKLKKLEVIAISKEIGRFPVQVATNWLQQKAAPKVGTNLKKILNHLN
ncbi:unnamed protein product [Rhizophagus irregularis]|uniref:Uncharacterized protein n=2 Tax=Rhizophagus irregularis TaxID=588596 RepID=A0A916E3N0_9GLOM|nr:unnamed protein product [Rhizophagus irregularis]CAB5216723.1 unnamed protein product [Rhizophagus irregularis]CAB5358039.1 unnamed protein product [Rhizophagus irregularis]